jgi:hypothetical protein
MSKKYIKQVSSNNFIYPNNTLEEYDIEIIHNINSNVVSGSISGFTAVASGSNIIISFSYNWNLNGAEPYINSTNNLSILSVHMMDSNVQYFKPWRMIGFVQDANVNLTTKTGSVSYTVTPEMLGVNTFLTGTYNLEIRMIGKLEVQPICVQATLLAPTPTPTATSTTPTPTPTITPTRVTPTPTNTPSATSGGGSYRYYLI